MRIMAASQNKTGPGSLAFGPALVLLAVSALLAASSSCSLYTPEKDLNPINAEFLSKVRYIITGEERRTFLELSDSEKEKFVEEFWRRRDPDPGTEENEFKTEYFSRIGKADELFSGEGRPGWLTDRGRIFILYGPPLERRISPVNDNRSKACQEIWFYKSYPLTFVDSSCSGTYVLITLDLTPIDDLNISRPATGRRENKEKTFFDFNFRQTVSADEAGRIEGIFILEVPFERIWFGAEGDTLKTTLHVEAELREGRENLGWQFKQDYEIKMNEAELKENRKTSYRIEIPFVLTQDLDKVRRGKPRVQIVLKNKTGGEELRKSFDFGKSN
jgi:GWxTD domain-containing protein